VDGNGAADIAVGSDMAFRLGRAGAGEVSVALLPGEAPDAPVAPEPTPTPTPAPVPTPAPPAGEPAPMPRLALADATLRADKRYRVRLTFRCAAADCRGRAVLTLGGKRSAGYAVQLAAGRSASVRVFLTLAQRKALRRAGLLRGRLTVTLASGGMRTLAVTIRAPKGR
jgi:hypothetical protein